MKTTINGIEYTSLPEGKTMKELGYKKGDWFIVTQGDHVGTKLCLHNDDETSAPWFKIMDDEHKYTNGERKSFYFSLLAPYTRTIDDVKEGDVITKGEYFRYVHGRCGGAVFVSGYKNNIDDATSNSDECFYWSLNSLKFDNYTLYTQTQQPEPKELTIKEIAEKFNMPVDKVRIKE